MTTTEELRVTYEGSEVVTPGARKVARRLSFWLILALILAIFVAVTVVLTGSAASRARLSATNAAPNGSEAVANVLRTDGVSVSVAHTLTTATKDVARDPDNTTLLVYDPHHYLLPHQIQQAGVTPATVVLVEPTTQALDSLVPGVAQAGYVPSKETADCSLSPVQKAGSVAGLGRGYRIIADKEDTTGCLGSGGGVYALIHVNRGSQTVWVLGSTTVLTNGSVLRAGDAALDLGVLGSHGHVVWYIPSFADVHSLQDGALPAPTWVPLVIALLGLTAVAAAIWRGRRFGAIVVERMPVFVKSNETAEGRARLYQKASARTHSLDSLRIGTIGRLASLCGLPARSSLEGVIGAVTRFTQRPADEIRALLVDDIPNSDRELIDLAGNLQALEKEVAAAVRAR